MSNVGSFDRAIRILVGLAALALPFLLGWSNMTMIASVIVGVILLATAAMSFCPLYAVLGLRTKRSRGPGNG